MAVLDFIFGQKLSGTSNPAQWLINWMASNKTASGEKVTEETALTCAAVKAAVHLLAKTVARLPLSVHERLPGGGSEPLPPANPYQRLLHTEPNPETSSFIFRETLQGHLGTWGVA